MSVFQKVITELKKNPTREYTPEQMRDHLRRERLGSFHVDVVSRALKQAYDTKVARRVRDGNHPFKYMSRPSRKNRKS